MSKTITTTFTHLAVAVSTLAGAMLLSGPVSAADTHWSGYAENATIVRDSVGLSKFRNTAQGEFDTKFKSDTFRSLKLHGVLRGTYDGVYDLNSDHFGKDATEPYLGANWHDNSTASSNTIFNAGAQGGVSLPCENDPTTCRNLNGYMDQKQNDVRFPEFNDKLDFIRELYVTADSQLSNGDVLSMRLGKQQVVWGKTDLFRVLDVINPVDYSRQNIYAELEDIRIPQWMLKVDWLMGANSVFEDSNLSLVWNFDQFRPDNLGTCGQPYRMLDAGCIFSSYLGPVGAGIPVIHSVQKPDWNLANTQLGLKWEGVYGDTTFSLNALTYRQQLPSLHWRGSNPAIPASDGVYDIRFPRVNLLGGSVDYYSTEMDAVWRLEMAYTQGEELPRDLWGYQQTDMLRYVIGFDKNLIIPQLGSPSAFQISAQLFGEHIYDHTADMPNDQDNWIATGLFKGFYMNNRLSPQIIVAHDFAAAATVYAPSLSWTPDNHWSFNVGLNIKTGGHKKFPWNATGGTSGPAQYEPLARFINGPIGVANQEDELQFTLRYSF